MRAGNNPPRAHTISHPLSPPTSTTIRPPSPTTLWVTHVRGELVAAPARFPPRCPLGLSRCTKRASRGSRHGFAGDYVAKPLIFLHANVLRGGHSGGIEPPNGPWTSGLALKITSIGLPLGHFEPRPQAPTQCLARCPALCSSLGLWGHEYGLDGWLLGRLGGWLMVWLSVGLRVLPLSFLAMGY